MRVRLQPWLLAIGLVAICVSVLGGMYWYRARVEWTPAKMVSYLPHVDATIAYLDLEKIRDAGLFDLLAGSKTVEEVDYSKFVDESGFDYKTDLDRVVIAFQGDNRFVVARGKFDWKRINDYLLSLGGKCHNSVCEFHHTEPFGRTVSYYPIRTSVMALYSGPSDGGAYDLTQRPVDDQGAAVSGAPVWVSVPASAWTSAKDLPAGGKIFAPVFGDARRVVFSIDADAQKNLKLYGDVTCDSADAASKVSARLVDATDMLRKLITREKQKPGAGDLSALLAAGSFAVDGTHVKATWPLERAFIEALVSGSVN